MDLDLHEILTFLNSFSSLPDRLCEHLDLDLCFFGNVGYGGFDDSLSRLAIDEDLGRHHVSILHCLYYASNHSGTAV